MADDPEIGRNRSRLRPFFTFYGGKWRLASRYPPPQHDLIVEPFAGSAGYAMRYADRQVWINDVDEKIAGTWEYLIATPADEIRSLPLLDGVESVDDLTVCQEARWLIGWWLNKGAASPMKSPSAWQRSGLYDHHVNFWSDKVRERVASQVDRIRHWKITNLSYADLDTPIATWFVDPPYVTAGKYYRHGPDRIDYTHLGDWCRSLNGQVMVCENDGADWLPFQPFHVAKANESKSGGKRSHEVLWQNGGAR